MIFNKAQQMAKRIRLRKEKPLNIGEDNHIHKQQRMSNKRTITK